MDMRKIQDYDTFNSSTSLSVHTYQSLQSFVVVVFPIKKRNPAV